LGRLHMVPMQWAPAGSRTLTSAMDDLFEEFDTIKSSADKLFFCRIGAMSHQERSSVSAKVARATLVS